jgi:hypothetical protein
MANLIDSSYFINDINLPNNYLTGTGELISDYIDKYEKEVLIKLLGYDLYKLVIASPLTYADLITGAEYSIGNQLRKWDGLTNSDKDSLIAYYVYYHFVLDQVNSMEGIGAVISQGENSVKTAPDLLLIKAWNRYIDLYNKCVEFLMVNHTDYPTWIYTPEYKNNQFGI